jgi:hypothetical protein
VSAVLFLVFDPRQMLESPLHAGIHQHLCHQEPCSIAFVKSLDDIVLAIMKLVIISEPW